MIVKRQFTPTLVLLVGIAVAQALTLAMVAHLYWKAYRVSSAFAELGKAFAPPAAPAARTPTTRERTPPVAAAIIPEPRSVAMTNPAEAVRIDSVDTRVTERNSSWSKFAYVVTVTNSGDRPATFRVKVEWTDSGNFVVDDDTSETVTLQPLETRTITGYDLVSAGPAANVDKIQAVIQAR